jgi:hypothetical protein
MGERGNILGLHGNSTGQVEMSNAWINIRRLEKKGDVEAREVSIS